MRSEDGGLGDGLGACWGFAFRKRETIGEVRESPTIDGSADKHEVVAVVVAGDREKRRERSGGELRSGFVGEMRKKFGEQACFVWSGELCHAGPLSMQVRESYLRGGLFE